MAMKEYRSGSELQQYLYISTRKMKYLMDHNYIPHESTGQTTHKYRVRYEDAEKFKQRMEAEKGFLAELTGPFSNQREHHPVPLLEVTKESCDAFKSWLMREWTDLPDAIPTQQVVKLIGGTPQQIHRPVREGKRHSVTVKGEQYCAKDEIIDYISSPEKLNYPVEKIYQELIRAFKRRKRRERENEKRRVNRKRQMQNRSRVM